MGALFSNVPSLGALHVPTVAELGIITNLLAATGPDGGLWPEQRFDRTADQVFQTQTVLQNDAVFSIPVAANARYNFFGWFIYLSSAAALFKCAWTMPTGTTGFWTTGAYPSTVTASPGQVDLQLVGLATVKTLGVAASNTTSFAPMGNIITGSTSGFVTFQFAQVNSTAVNTGMKAGAWLSATRTL